jgi:MoxR-like ATPase
MAPEAHIWFIDEFFNANGPLLHLMLPMLNERVFQNNDPDGDGLPTPIPLWTAFMGTNKLNADADQAATWDRVHIRTTVDYVKDHDNLVELARAGMRRRISGWTEPEKTTITFDELVAAHDAAMQLPVPDSTVEALLVLRDELGSAGIELSPRRWEDGWVAAAANAWRKGHEQVEVVDLDILTNMWWTLQSDEDKARKVILGHTNPGEKAALELLDALDKDRAQLGELKDSGADRAKVARMAMEIYKNCGKYMAQAEQLLEKAEAAGSNTVRIMELTGRAKKLQNDVQSEVFDA